MCAVPRLESAEGVSWLHLCIDFSLGGTSILFFFLERSSEGWTRTTVILPC